jgi:DNA-binding NarL/FixJ family response regulator
MKCSGPLLPDCHKGRLHGDHGLQRQPVPEGLLSLDPSVKAIIASGYSANGPNRDAFSAGAKGFVHKPYDIRQVLEVVRKILDGE